MSKLSKKAIAAGLREAARIGAGFVPGEVELAEAPLLTSWIIEPLPGGLLRLVGVVSGHPLIRDGWCTTSPLIAADSDAGWARTVSRYYRLGARLGEVRHRNGLDHPA